MSQPINQQRCLVAFTVSLACASLLSSAMAQSQPQITVTTHTYKHVGNLITIPNGEHGLGGGDPKLIDAAYESVVAFINRHMRR